MTMTYRWVGKDQDGRHRAGVADIDDVSEFVEDRYRRRWVSLAVRNPRGDLVGEIVDRRPHASRVWWTEKEEER